jgi:hypothetical protein
LLVLGSGVYNPYPIWRGLDQTVVEWNARGGIASHHPIKMADTDEGFALLYDGRPDVTVVANSLARIKDATIERLRSLPGVKGLWFNDLRPVKESVYSRFEGLFDAAFMCWNENDEYPLRDWSRVLKCPTYYMPQGSVINPYVKKYDEQRRSVFIGNVKEGIYHHGRKHFMDFTGTEVINAGKRPERVVVELKSEEIYRSSRYCTAFSESVRGYNSVRLYNILAYGGLCLVKNFPEINKLFTHKEHLLKFDGIDDAKALMAEYDEKPELRRRIAVNGWRQQQSKHTVLFRVLNMVANMTTNDRDFWGYL